GGASLPRTAGYHVSGGTSVCYTVDMATDWVCRLSVGRHLGRQGFACCFASAPRAIRIRNRQGRVDAVSPLVAQRHGCANASQCAVACCGGSEGRSLHYSEDHRIYLRHRLVAGDNSQSVVVLRRVVHAADG